MRQLLLTGLCFLCALGPVWPQSSHSRHYALRLKPGQEIKAELSTFLKTHQIKACAIVTCVGSLDSVNLRFAGEPTGTLVRGPLEIQALVGCGGSDKWHLHLSVADAKGHMTGGHLVDGAIVRTTAEIVIVELTELQFERVHDAQTGYPELQVLPLSDPEN